MIDPKVKAAWHKFFSFILFLVIELGIIVSGALLLRATMERLEQPRPPFDLEIS